MNELINNAIVITFHFFLLNFIYLWMNELIDNIIVITHELIIKIEMKLEEGIGGEAGSVPPSGLMDGVRERTC